MASASIGSPAALAAEMCDTTAQILHPLQFEAKRLTFVGEISDEWRFEAPDRRIKRIRAIADFYLRAQTPGGSRAAVP